MASEFLDKAGLSLVWQKIKTYIDQAACIRKVKFQNKELPVDASDHSVNIPAPVSTITKTQYQLRAHNVNGDHTDTLTISKVAGAEFMSISGWNEGEKTMVFDEQLPSKTYVDAKETALQEQIDAMGEPFRIKSFAKSGVNVEVPCVSEDILNTQIPNLDMTISGAEGADYQICGMLAYEMFDESGQRINCFPVCQFTQNGQTTLRVRMMCGGTTRKTIHRIDAWVLLKHR